MSSPRRILAAATVLHAVVGAWIATSITGPLLAIDDLAYLSMGRTLAGGGAAPLGAQPPYGVLYPTLLAPGWLMGLDESQMIVFAQLVNAVLGAALLPVLFALVRRLSDASFGRALGAATIGASLPAALLTGSIVWTERLLPLLTALAVLALLRVRDEASLRHGAEVAAVVAALVATHPRTIVVAAVVLLAALGIAGRRGSLRVGVAAALLGAVGVGLGEIARRALTDRTFGADATYDAADLAGRRGFDDATEMLVKGGGTVAYLVLATAGLAVLGAVLLSRHRAIAITYGAMVVATVAMAGWFLAGVERADSYLHGRYIETLAPLLVTLGVVAAARLPWRTSALVLSGSVVAAGIYGAWAGGGDNWADPRTPVMMLGVDVSGAPLAGSVFQPGAAAAVGVVAGLVILAAARGGVWEAPVVMSLLVAMAVISGTATIDSLRDQTTVGWVQTSLADVEIDALLVDSRVPSTLVGAVAWEVGFDRTTTDRLAAVTHQLLPPDAVAPDGATAAVEFGEGTLWALP
ncbi:MAG: hypothetical protein RIB98_16200 [Acidimicrobiales bacterium]